MRLVEFVPPTPHPLWELCPQMGITDVIVKVNPELTGLNDPWKLETLASIVSRLKSAGLTVVGLEGDPFDMTPIKEFGERGMGNGERGTGNGERGMGNGEREEALAHYRELLESMGQLGIKLLCYNFMVGKGWSRSGVREGRGGAKATYFSLKETEKERTSDFGHQASSTEVRSLKSEVLILTHEQVWANYEYFVKAVMPTAEKWGIRMGLHPDDPCLPSLGGYARIFGSIEAYDRAYAIYPSPSNAVTFCQANFKLMLGNGERGVRCSPMRRGISGSVSRSYTYATWRATRPTSRNSSTTRATLTSSRSCAPTAKSVLTCQCAATTCQRWHTTARSRLMELQVTSR